MFACDIQRVHFRFTGFGKVRGENASDGAATDYANLHGIRCLSLSLPS